MTRRLWAVLAVLCVSLSGAPAVGAYEPVNVVHSERIQVGPYGLIIGFSTWPVRAEQSLDYTFVPDGGIADKTGTLSITPVGRDTERRPGPLVRHPRKLDVWGLDIRALRQSGDHVMRFRLDGPAGPGEGDLTLPVLEQPGPPMALSWGISTIPLLVLVGFLIVVWRRTRRAVSVVGD